MYYMAGNPDFVGYPHYDYESHCEMSEEYHKEWAEFVAPEPKWNEQEDFGDLL